jgi:nitroreductase
MRKKSPVIIVVLILIATSILTMESLSTKAINSEVPLPPSLSVNMSYRDAIFSRCSVRRFKQMEAVSDEELSTVLWAAYGYRDDGSRTVPGLDGLYSTVIYVFREDGTYTYNPLNHSLVLFSEEDLRDTVNWQHRAPIQLGLVWDKDINSDEDYSSVEIGEIGQNIYFMSSALGLGTVTAGLTGFDEIELPDNELGRIVMPLGYPSKTPVFEYSPKVLSLLPRLQDSTENLKTVIEERREGDSFNGKIVRKEMSQLLWAAYGFSYLIDKTDSITNEVQRHRTVPSASCVYPLVMYAVNSFGIFRYFPHILHLNPYSDNPYYSTNWGFPIVSFLFPVRLGDHRAEIAQACLRPDIASAPLTIVSVLPSPSLFPVQWYWYYEAGASAYNVMLEATILGLNAGIVRPVDFSSVKSILRLRNNSLPLIIIPIGE